MPFINGAQVSVADGRVQMTTAVVAGTDDYLGGLRYDQITSAIRVAASGPALGAPEFINAAATPPGGFTAGYRIGMTYRMTVAGEAVAARFWRIGTSPITSRVMYLFDGTTQALLATSPATVGETGAGWNNVTFAAPIPFVANQKLTIAYEETNTHAGAASACPVVNAAHATYVNANYVLIATGGYPTNVQMNQTYYADLSCRFSGPAADPHGFPVTASGQLLIDQAGTRAAYYNGLSFTAADALMVGVGATPVVHIHGWPIAADGRLCVNLI